MLACCQGRRQEECESVIVASMDEDKSLAVLDEIDDEEVREILSKSPEAREAIHAAINYAVDSTAMNVARRMLSDVNVPDGVKKDLLLGWLEHRRKDKELVARVKSGSMSEGITFNFNVATDVEAKNVRQAREVFGVETVEDATVERE